MSEKKLTDSESSADGERSHSSAAKKRSSQRRVIADNTPGDLLAQHQAKGELDRQLVQSLSVHTRRWPSWRQLRKLGHFLSPKEYYLLRLALGSLLIAVVVLVANVWFFTLQLEPAFGGEYSEGLIGSPRYINPILAAANDVDRDISSLVFCGLMKAANGSLEPDLAESYTISDDQQEYTVVLRRGVTWQGSDREVTANDVLLTFDLIKDPEVGSPLAVSFRGITAEPVDDYTIKFVLKEPFAPFLSTLTFGVLPEYLWSTLDSTSIRLSELNLKPVGCGPFKFDSLKKDSQGTIRSFTLAANTGYSLGSPYLAKVTFKFYPDFTALEQALLNKNISAASFLPRESRDKIFGNQDKAKGFTAYELNLPQYSAVFFNQNNNPAVKEKAVRQALAQAIDRQRIVQQVLGDQAVVVNSPILPGAIGYTADTPSVNFAPAEATALLDNAKWQGITPNNYLEAVRVKERAATPAGQEFVDRSDEERLAEITDQEYFRKKGDQLLTVNLTVVNQPESLAVAKIIQENWQAIGVRTVLNMVSPESVLRQVIRTHSYEAFLYSEIVGYDPDPYPFWHSSQAGENGLNLSLLNDKRVDKVIIAGRQTTDVAARAASYQTFQDILAQEIPAIFLYSPTYTYVVDSDVRGLQVQRIFVPADRLSDLWRRYIEVKRALP
ncbi:hypothetical protein HY933_00630 [Candidatus Falkowbacteria bacterium]|nr:hypothetical protein [Candidatus Falkowbacteria bacterium]